MTAGRLELDRQLRRDLVVVAATREHRIARRRRRRRRAVHPAPVIAKGPGR